MPGPKNLNEIAMFQSVEQNFGPATVFENHSILTCFSGNGGCGRPASLKCRDRALAVRTFNCQDR